MKINNRYGRGLRKCILLLICICTLLVLTACSNEPAEISYDTPREWTPVYNDHEHGLFISPVLPGAFEEELTQEDIAKLLPSKPLPYEVYRAKVMFKEDRSVYTVVLYIDSPEAKTVVAFGEGAMWSACCAVWKKGENQSLCADVEYTLYEFDNELKAEAVINDTNMHVRTRGAKDKKHFEAILECFSWYSKGKPDLSQIVPREH